ncbi:MAG: ribosome-associated toxin RatA of RatAB toxin-antitoxin module [Candidatus Poriferisodalaceae bacterium]|jgi:ribosome-associated toxin RatA of RatAB toxin-antitoxin module
MIDEMTVTRLVFASPARCHELVADVGAYGEWARDLKGVSIDSSDESGRPSQATFRVGAMGRSATYTLGYDHSEGPEVIRWSLVEGDIVRLLDGSYEFLAVDGEPDQTQVRYHLRVELAVPLPGFVKRRAEGRIMHAALDDLQARVEVDPAL